MSNSYSKALAFIQRNPGSSGGLGLAKLILSIYNAYHCYSIRECLEPLDRDNTDLALAMIRLHAAGQERQSLNEAGAWVYENFPRLVEQSSVMQEARERCRNRWDREREQENND